MKYAVNLETWRYARLQTISDMSRIEDTVQHARKFQLGQPQLIRFNVNGKLCTDQFIIHGYMSDTQNNDLYLEFSLMHKGSTRHTKLITEVQPV